MLAGAPNVIFQISSRFDAAQGAEDARLGVVEREQQRARQGADGLAPRTGHAVHSGYRHDGHRDGTTEGRTPGLADHLPEAGMRGLLWRRKSWLSSGGIA
jgi:hypothetical protein